MVFLFCFVVQLLSNKWYSCSVLLLASLQLPSLGGVGGGLSVDEFLILLSLEELYLVQDKGLLGKMPSIDFLQVFVSGDNPVI